MEKFKKGFPVVVGLISEVDEVVGDGYCCPDCGRHLFDFSDEYSGSSICPVCGYYCYSAEYAADDHSGSGYGSACYLHLGCVMNMRQYSTVDGIREFREEVLRAGGGHCLFAWYTVRVGQAYRRVFLKGNAEIAAMAMRQFLEHDIENRWCGASTRASRDEVLALMRLVADSDIEAEKLTEEHLKGDGDGFAFSPDHDAVVKKYEDLVAQEAAKKSIKAFRPSPTIENAHVAKIGVFSRGKADVVMTDHGCGEFVLDATEAFAISAACAANRHGTADTLQDDAAFNVEFFLSRVNLRELFLCRQVYPEIEAEGPRIKKVLLKCYSDVDTCMNSATTADGVKRLAQGYAKYSHPGCDRWRAGLP